MENNEYQFQRNLVSSQSSFCGEMLNKSFFASNGIRDAEECSKNWSSEDRSISKIINDATNLKNSGYSQQQNSESNDATEINQSIIWATNIKSQNSSQFKEKYRGLKKNEAEKEKLKSKNDIVELDSERVNIKDLISSPNQNKIKSLNQEEQSGKESVIHNPLNFSFKVKGPNFAIKHKPIYVTAGLTLEAQEQDDTPLNKPFRNSIIIQSGIKAKNESTDYGLDIEEFTGSGHALNTKTIESSDKSFNNHTRNISEQLDEMNINQISSVNFKNVNLHHINEKINYSQGIDSPKFISYQNSNKSSFAMNNDGTNIYTPNKQQPHMLNGQMNPQNLFGSGMHPYSCSNINFGGQFTPKGTYVPKHLRGINCGNNASNNSTISSCNAANSIKKQESEIFQDKKAKISIKIPTEESVDSFYSTKNASGLPSFPNIFPSPTNLQMNFYQPNFNTISHHNSNNPFSAQYCHSNLNAHMYKPSLVNLSKTSHYSTFMTSSNYSSMGSSIDVKDSRLTDVVIEDYLSGKNKKTTLMIKNIPNRYDVDSILSEIHELGFKNKYDCFYLPIDMKDPQVKIYYLPNRNH